MAEERDIRRPWPPIRRIAGGGDPSRARGDSPAPALPHSGVRKSPAEETTAASADAITISVGSLWHEQKPSEGEDAEPLAVACDPSRAFLGVFDGLGGSGGSRYQTELSTRTGAYLASRFAREVIDREINNRCDESESTKPAFSEDPAAFAACLETLLRNKLNHNAGKLPAEASKIRSSLLRVLPTTLVFLCLEPSGSEGKVSVYWAGDSRAYRLNPKAGLCQLTIDDLETPLDALENLRNDSQMANVVSASHPFHINHARVETSEREILFAATDGCFSYFETPWHFEYVLLETLQDAGSPEKWMDLLKQRIVSVAGDDASLAFASYGWQTFEEMKVSFQPRARLVFDRYVRPVIDLDEEVNEARSHLEGSQKRFDAARANWSEKVDKLWGEYRKSHDVDLPIRAEDGNA